MFKSCYSHIHWDFILFTHTFISKQQVSLPPALFTLNLTTVTHSTTMHQILVSDTSRTHLLMLWSKPPNPVTSQML